MTRLFIVSLWCLNMKPEYQSLANQETWGRDSRSDKLQPSTLPPKETMASIRALTLQINPLRPTL